MSAFKDGVPANSHPLNLLPDGAEPPPVTRIPLYEVYMRMAEELAKRSTCSRLQVGTVVTDQLLENVLAIGYNGNARGLPNRCDSAVPGSCGCIHSEMNALVKAPGSLRDKVVFISASPCVMCAKLIINAGVRHPCAAHVGRAVEQRLGAEWRSNHQGEQSEPGMLCHGASME